MDLCPRKPRDAHCRGDDCPLLALAGVNARSLWFGVSRFVVVSDLNKEKSIVEPMTHGS